MDRDIQLTIATFVAAKLARPLPQIPTNVPFTTLGADSLDQIELIIRVESEYDIDIPDEDAEELHTIDDLTTYVAEAIRTKVSIRESPGRYTRRRASHAIGRAGTQTREIERREDLVAHHSSPL